MKSCQICFCEMTKNDDIPSTTDRGVVQWVSMSTQNQEVPSSNFTDALVGVLVGHNFVVRFLMTFGLN